MFNKNLHFPGYGQGTSCLATWLLLEWLPLVSAWEELGARGWTEGQQHSLILQRKDIEQKTITITNYNSVSHSISSRLISHVNIKAYLISSKITVTYNIATSFLSWSSVFSPQPHLHGFSTSDCKTQTDSLRHLREKRGDSWSDSLDSRTSEVHEEN